jgi:hypothetical protein
VNTGQLRLTSHGDAVEPLVLSFEVSDQLLTRLRDLGVAGQLELSVRAPAALADLVARIAYVQELGDTELRQRAMDTERELHHLRREQARRGDERRCPECKVHRENGHLITCELGRRAA